jgi:anaerobic magnesium-protoporphyrin IX monomethyl ester cyclase
VRILLMSMPDSFEHTPTVAIRMPNGALTSLAGNVDPHHQVAVADLLLVQSHVRSTVERLVREHDPALVGFSVMTFQRSTARRLMALVRALKPDVRIVVGGYDPSLAPEAYAAPALGVDFLVRGEGELTFRDLVRALERNGSTDDIPGLWVRTAAGLRPAARRPIARIEDDEVAVPNRSARVLSGYTFMGRPVDVVETSRGCTFDCSFCSIIEMRGRNFHRFSIERVLDDIRDARAHGARVIFIVDDNVTLDVRRFADLCRAIIDAGLNTIDYLVQAMTSSIAAHGGMLAPLMRRAGFRYVFLGIENVVERDLQFLNASAKNRTRGSSTEPANATLAAVNALHEHHMLVVGGLIVGNPDDTRESIAANLDFARRYVDWPYIQHPTPYPGTPMTADFVSRGLVVNARVEEYDGTTAVTRSEALDVEEIEFLRWKSDRWMKLRHMPVAFRHDPIWVVRNARRMFAHTFRGTTWRSMVGLEDPRAAFRRYRAIRAQERQYVDWPDPLAADSSNTGVGQAPAVGSPRLKLVRH